MSETEVERAAATDRLAAAYAIFSMHVGFLIREGLRSIWSEEMKGIITELKNVMIRRRRVDLAAGIVLAGAFRAAMTSLINDVILPPVSTFMAGTNISNLSYVLKKPTAGMPPVVIGYGRFLQTTIDFMIIGIAIMLILRATEKITDKAESKPTKQEVLLKEIRDLLNVQANADKRPRIKNPT